MMTPQEVSSRAFSKAPFGGYNMSMVDEFLDLLTEDYTTLYNDNAILKNKLKVLSDTLEEYRATDDAMRKTLLAAQQMAESMVKDAEQKKTDLLADAESAAQAQIDQLRGGIAAEEYRLKTAQEATAAYVAKVRKLYQAQDILLSELDKLVPEGISDSISEAAQDIESSLDQILSDRKEPAKPEPEPVPEPEPEAEPEPEPEPEAEPRQAPEAEAAEKRPGKPPISPDATRRFEDLQFGRDYEIR